MNDLEQGEQCQDCGDSGWVRYECTGDRSCGRRRRHQPHTYARHCPCRPFNRNFQERQEQQRRHAA